MCRARSTGHALAGSTPALHTLRRPSGHCSTSEGDEACVERGTRGRQHPARRKRSDRVPAPTPYCAGLRKITTMAAATRIPASTIAAQTHPDSPDDDAAGATAATVVLVAVGADSA